MASIHWVTGLGWHEEALVSLNLAGVGFPPPQALEKTAIKPPSEYTLTSPVVGGMLRMGWRQKEYVEAGASTCSSVEIPSSAVTHKTARGGCHNLDRPSVCLNYSGGVSPAQDQERQK